MQSDYRTAFTLLHLMQITSVSKQESITKGIQQYSIPPKQHIQVHQVKARHPAVFLMITPALYPHP